LFASERQNLIRKLIGEKGAVTVSELVSEFGVSIETVRRDLLALEKAGVLSRVHGGAIPRAHLKPAGNFSTRLDEHRPEKNELSVCAAELICDGDVIAIDSGTTAVEFAEVLKSLEIHFVVITHSLAVFNILSDCENIETILIGGTYDKAENAFWGHLTQESLRRLHVSKAFIFPTGISLSLGVSDFHLNLTDVQHTLLGITDKVIVLADSSKFEKTSLIKLCDLSPEHIYVTDSELPDGILELYKENNITVLKGENVR